MILRARRIGSSVEIVVEDDARLRVWAVDGAQRKAVTLHGGTIRAQPSALGRERFAIALPAVPALLGR